ncbi:Fic family protein [Planococcus shixiaomingii]|uniref:Fic family protein n=1 Tax=Planococcus shixiaomingii TaxID=3058393 RepID=UPI00345CA6AE
MLTEKFIFVKEQKKKRLSKRRYNLKRKIIHPRSRSEMQVFLGIKSLRYLRAIVLNSLIESRALKLTLPDKPTSPKQKYYTVTK